MRLLVDAQLPPALARWLVDRGHEAGHDSIMVSSLLPIVRYGILPLNVARQLLRRTRILLKGELWRKTAQ
jgi:hypothetical protein